MTLEQYIIIWLYFSGWITIWTLITELNTYEEYPKTRFAVCIFWFIVMPTTFVIMLVMAVKKNVVININKDK